MRPRPQPRTPRRWCRPSPRASCLLSHVRTLDAAAQPGDHLVGDGAGRGRPVLGRRLTVAAGPEQRDDVTAGGWRVTEIDDELVHADDADLAGPRPAEADLRPVGRRAQDALAV